MNMKERTFYVLMILLMPVAFLFTVWLNYDDFIETGFLFPMLVAMPFGMLFSYLIYIRGIYDGKLFELFEHNKKG